MSIIDGDIYICDFCGKDFGSFDVETGNHPDCEELVRLRKENKRMHSALVRVRGYAEICNLNNENNHYPYIVALAAHGLMEVVK